MTWELAMTKIEDLLKDVILRDGTNIHFSEIYRGEPIALPPVDRICSFWYAGRGIPPEGEATLSNRMVRHRLTLEAYWRPRIKVEDIRELDLEVHDTVTNVLTAIHAEALLDGYVSRVQIDEVTAGYKSFGRPEAPEEWRAIAMTVFVDDLNGEPWTFTGTD